MDCFGIDIGGVGLTSEFGCECHGGGLETWFLWDERRGFQK